MSYLEVIKVVLCQILKCYLQPKHSVIVTFSINCDALVDQTPLLPKHKCKYTVEGLLLEEYSKRIIVTFRFIQQCPKAGKTRHDFEWEPVV